MPFATKAFPLSRRLYGAARRGVPLMIAFEVAFRVLIAALVAPVAAWAIAALVARSGSAALSNSAIAEFLLSPAGLAAAVLWALGYLFSQLLLSAGLMALAALSLADRRMTLGHALGTATRSSLRLLRFGVKQLAGLTVIFAPFLGLAGLTYGLLLSGHDINYYLAEKPPAFLIALGIGAVLGVGLLALLTVIYVRGLFVVPILLFEGGSVGSALRASHALTRGSSWQIGAMVMGWHASVMVLALLVGWVYVVVCARLIMAAGTRLVVLVPLASALLAGHILLVSALAFAQVAGSCLLTVDLHDQRSGGRARAWAEAIENVPAQRLRLPVWSWGLALIAILAGLAVLSARLLSELRVDHTVTVTAHRGASRDAPENTLAAVRKAIEHGADYAEIDIHLTADGVPVVLHDEDLQRLAGVPKRPSELTLAELQRIDIGSRFSPAFAGETVPTLAAVIDLARGRIRLNIELKSTERDPKREALGATVADLIRSENFERDCFVTSLDHEAVAAARRRNPRLRTGEIVAAAVGDVSQLDVDVLSIRSSLITDRLLSRVHAAGKEVHAWTVDDPKAMGALIDQGIDGLITNDPVTALAVRRERQALPAWERVVLGFRRRLGEPER
jgi:glycerophosphoryl diester phosphodiesterase